jgi:hypothetical protein
MRGLVKVVGHARVRERSEARFIWDVARTGVNIAYSRYPIPLVSTLPLDLTFSGEIYGRGLIPDVV